MSATGVVGATFEELKPVRSNAPRVSAIVPMFNMRAHAREAVESLLAQTFPDLEVIVVDDASTDGSSEELMSIDDPRLRIVRLQRNVGSSGARNAAIALSRGEFIALLDADDIALPQRIERQLRVFEARPNVALVGCLVNRIDVHGRMVTQARDEWRVADAALKPLLLFTNPFPAVYMLRRSTIPAHGFRSMYAEDYALAADIADLYDVALVREPLVNYRMSPGGNMASKFDLVAEGALSVQRRLLGRVGVPESSYDADLMRALIYSTCAPATTMTLDRLACIRRFLHMVRTANGASGVYAAEDLAEAATRAWEITLAGAARCGGLRFGVRSPGLFLSHFSTHASTLRARALARTISNLLRTRDTA